MLGETEAGGSRLVWRSFQRFCWRYLYAVGGREKEARRGEKGRGGLWATEVAKVERQAGYLSVSQVLRVRVRYFTESVAFGSQAWVEGMFANNREKLQVKRKVGARKLKALGLEKWRGLIDRRSMLSR